MAHRPHTILVTGGAGFIGSNFLLQMVPAHPDVRFVNVDRLSYAANLMNLREIEEAENYVFERADVADVETMRALFAKYDVTSVVHFAAESHVDRSIRDPLAFVRSNTLGTVSLLEAAREHWNDEGDHRFLHVSTDEVFGDLDDEGYFSETTPYDPHSPYSASKASSDHFVRAYGHTYDLPVLITNCTNNYGPYQFPEKLIPLVIMKARDLEPIPVYGKGENVRDWLHVRDHCSAIERVLLDGETGRTYAVGGDAERRNIDLVREIARIVDEELGRPDGTAEEQITFVTDRPGHDFRYAMDTTRIREELGWQPDHSLEEGLRETIRWYLSHEEWLASVVDDSYRAYYDEQYATT